MNGKLPYDVKQECLWIVRGYKRRMAKYLEDRENIICGGPSRDMPINNMMPGRPVENKAIRLEHLESSEDVKKIRAVDGAKVLIGQDIQDIALRERIRDGIILNCISGKIYSFERLGIDGISRASFYRRKDIFLLQIAKYLGLW